MSPIANGRFEAPVKKSQRKLTDQTRKGKTMTDMMKIEDSQPQTKKGSGLRKKKRHSSTSEDMEVGAVNPHMEEVLEATYVEDFINSVDALDDIARQNSLLLETHADQLMYLKLIDAEMLKLLDGDWDGENEELNMQKIESLKSLQTLLLQVSEVNDGGVRASDEVQSIIEHRMHILTIDNNNLCNERAKSNPDAPKAETSERKVKKLSINPGSRSRATPKKGNFQTKLDSNVEQKVKPFPNDLSTAACISPAPSCTSSSSLDNKSGNDANAHVETTVVDDSRYRSCKFKNPPTYVFNGRFPNSNCSTPKESESGSKWKHAKDFVKLNNDESPTPPQKPSGNSRGSISKQVQDTDTAEDSWMSSSSSDSDHELKEKSPEPTYCLCEKISHGKMVQCDNELCPVEWFHFRCVNLKKIPKGKWYCPRCRGENLSTMKPKSVFFKELEDYNKEKEQSTT